MLLGAYLVKLAANHRTVIPSPFRGELGKEIIIAKWYEGCLVVVSKNSLNALLTRIKGKAEFITAPVRGSEYFIFTGAYEVAVDEQGRVVIPESLIAYARLTEDIYFLGVGDRVEIWDKKAWEEKEKEVTGEAANYIEELAKND